MNTSQLRVLLLIFFIVPLYLTAQVKTSYLPEVFNDSWFKDIPRINSSTPLWAETMYLESTNYEKVIRQYTEHYKTEKFVKNIHTQNYKYYRRHVENHIDENGIVHLPAPGEVFKKAELRKKERNTSDRSMTNIWTNMGPSHSYNGGDTNTKPVQAHVSCIGVAPSNTSIAYCGVETGGVYKTIDKGLNWTPVTYEYAIGNLQDVKVDPLDPDIVYIASGSVIYKTTDGGTTWNLLFTATAHIEHFYIHSSSTNILYAATRDGLYKSTDNGNSWTLKYDGYVYDIEPKPGNEDILYISVKNNVTVRPEIMKSIDSGDSWTLMDNGFYSPSVLSEASVSGCKIGTTPADPNRIYAGIIANGKNGDNGWIGIYYSLDEGLTWQEDSGFDGGPYASGDDMNTNWYVAGYSSGYHQGWYNFDIDVSHTNPDKLWIGTIWFCESGNKGANIEYVRGTRNLAMHADIQDIDVVGDEIWVVSDGGVNFSNDECQTMETRMSGITASDFWGFGMGWNDDIWTGGRYHNGNASYYKNYGDGNTILLGGAEDPTGYVHPLDNKINYFTDVGAKRIPNSLSETAYNVANLSIYPNQSYFHFSYSEVEWHPYHTNVVYVGKNNELFKSVDGGSNFESIFTFPGETRRFEISRDDPDYIYMLVYVSTYDWRTYRSTDGGANFTELPEPTLTGGSWRNLSLTLNPFDKNEIWLASNNSSNGNKIFSSTDGGSTWINHYDATIADQSIKDMIYHASPDGDKIYTLTNDDFFYLDKDTEIWTQYKDGLPLQPRGFMILPFYKDNKIRMASAKGIWEIPFETESTVQAMPMVNKDAIYCNKDTVQFESHSIINQDGVTWEWSFNPTPQYVEDTSIRNPKVVFGTNGNVDATLTITDSNGNTDSRTVTSILNIQNLCEPDLVAGSALQTFENGDRVVIPNANLENVTNFTITGWWKPEGNQQAYAALVSSGDWCAHCDYTEGLIFDYYGSKLWYKWPGMSDNWGSNSGIDIPIDEWSYVALTIEPTKATLYLNDQKYVHNKALSPGNITNLYLGYGHYSKSFKGLIDEVSIWTKTLTEDEIYKLRHITKEEIIPTDPDLISYYQNNTFINENTLLDHAGTRHGVREGGAILTESSVPVGSGISQLVEITPGTHNYDFIELESSITLNDCLDSEGKVVLTRIETASDINPNNNDSPTNYWVINSYSDNGALGQVDALNLKVTDSAFLTGLAQTSDAVLHTRSENGEGANWSARASSIDLNGNILSFDRKTNINSSIQIGLTNLAPGLTEIDPGNPCEVDTTAGNTLILDGSGDYAEIPALDLNTNNFSVSAWVKPNGIQTSWSGIVFCRGNGTTSGLSCADNNELRYHWDSDEYGWSSGAYLPEDEWSHVALVISPTDVTIFLNGVAHNRQRNHAVESFSYPTRIGSDQTSSSRYFNGQIDEVCIWDRSLDINDIRLLRHLTKDGIIPSDTNLKAYYQFNEDDGVIFDRSTNNFHASLKGDSFRDASSAPVGGGESQQLDVTTAGIYSTTPGLDLEFNTSGTYPDGELVVSRINTNPDILPNTNESSGKYWVINNYGNNQTFTSLESMKFKELGELIDMTSPPNLRLHSRLENGFGAQWSQQVTGTQIITTEEAVIYSAGLNVQEFGQYIIEKSDGIFWIGIENTDWNNPNNWGGGTLPNATDHVIIPANVPFYPVVNIDGVSILTLCVELGASLTVPNQFNFDVLIGS